MVYAPPILHGEDSSLYNFTIIKEGGSSVSVMGNSQKELQEPPFIFPTCQFIYNPYLIIVVVLCVSYYVYLFIYLYVPIFHSYFLLFVMTCSMELFPFDYNSSWLGTPGSVESAVIQYFYIKYAFVSSAKIGNIIISCLLIPCVSGIGFFFLSILYPKISSIHIVLKDIGM